MNSPHKTLVIRFSSIGDVILSTPLLRVLRARFPDSQIDYVTRSAYAELVQFNANLNVTHSFDASTGFAGLRDLKRRLRKERYDLVIDLHNGLRSRYIRSMLGVPSIVVVDKRVRERTMLVKLKKNTYRKKVSVPDRYIETLSGFDIHDDGKGAEIHIPDEILFRVSGKMGKLKLNRFEHVIGLCPFARHGTKEWPLEKFVEVGVKAMKELNAGVIIFGGKVDIENANRFRTLLGKDGGEEKVINLAGECSLLESAAAMQFCDVIISNDSGLMHMASAMEKNVVAIFGPTVEEFGFFPSNKNSVVMERKGLYCRPCSHLGFQKCPEKHFRCMSEIGGGDVFEAAKQFLKA